MEAGMLGIPIGLLYSNAMEWTIHKYVLHGPGKKRGTFWSFHFHEHHRAARSNNHIDTAYRQPPFGRDAQSKEVIGLAVLTLFHLPLLPVAPFFTGTLVYGAVDYYRKHKRAHLDTEWARTHLPWHYDHHMGPNQDANWCVTRPWFDHIMGTRVQYSGTEKEQADYQRRVARLAKLPSTETPAPDLNALDSQKSA